MSAPVTLVVAGDPVPNYDALQHLIARQNEVRTDLVVSNLELRAAIRDLIASHPLPLSKAVTHAKQVLAHGGR